MLTIYAYSQPTLSLSTIAGSTVGDTITVYMTGANLINIPSISPSFTFDATVLEYVSSDYASVFDSGFTVINVIPPTLPSTLATWMAAWVALNPITVVYDTLFGITFIFLGGTTNLTFAPWPGFTLNNGTVSSLGVGITDETSESPSLEIFPNPSGNGEIHLLYNDLKGKYTLEIFSQDGKLLQSHNIFFQQQDQQLTLPVNVLPGSYFLRLTGAQGVLARKFILR